MSSTSGENPTREWVLDPETEYRFELDQGTTLAVKVFNLTTYCALGVTTTRISVIERMRRGIWC